MSDPFEDHMDSRLGLNEPAPEEPEDVRDAQLMTGIIRTSGAVPESTCRPSIPEIGQQFIENTKQRVERNSWRRANAGAKLAIDALRENGDAKL